VATVVSAGDELELDDEALDDESGDDDDDAAEESVEDDCADARGPASVSTASVRPSSTTILA
jgi:hypothetical protein